MKITEDFLTINNWSRPGKKLESILAIVMHWTANPRASAKANRDYFEQRKCGSDGYGSAHYIIDQDGSVIHAIPLPADQSTIRPSASITFTTRSTFS